MADLPTHSDTDDVSAGSNRPPAAGSTRSRRMVWIAAAGAAFVALVVLHLTGVLGAGSH